MQQWHGLSSLLHAQSGKHANMETIAFTDTYDFSVRFLMRRFVVGMTTASVASTAPVVGSQRGVIQSRNDRIDGNGFDFIRYMM